MPAREDSLQYRPAQFPARGASDRIHPFSGKCSVIVGQIKRTSVLRQVGNHEVTSKTDRKTDNAIHYKKPLPPFVTQSSVQASVDSRLKVSGKHPRRGRRRVENAGPFPQLARLVPATDQEVCGRIEDTLDETD